MHELAAERMTWRVEDLDLLPDDGTRYEIIDGELFISTAPDWEHQMVCGLLFSELHAWSQKTGLVRANIGPGVLFSAANAVIPDVVWISKARMATVKGDRGRLEGAPELAIEVLSPGAQNERRDREAKLRLYSIYGVQEYWIVDWQLQQIAIYRREQAHLHLVATLLAQDELTSPLLPGFSCPVARLFI